MIEDGKRGPLPCVEKGGEEEELALITEYNWVLCAEINSKSM